MSRRPWFGRRSPGGRVADGPDATGFGAGPVPGSPVPGGPGASAAGSAPAGVAAPLITIDALGRECPIPIIMLAEQIRDVPVGGIIAVLADDPAAYTDIPAWCSLKSHDCVYRGVLPSGWSFGVRRRY